MENSNHICLKLQVDDSCVASPCAFGCNGLGDDAIACGCPSGFSRIGSVSFLVDKFVFSYPCKDQSVSQSVLDPQIWITVILYIVVCSF